MKVWRVSLSHPLIGAALFLAGCGQQTESVDSSTTPPPSLPASSEQNSPAKSGWVTNYEKAQEEAKANNKLVLLDFTGSDWCGWCILLDREVFSKPQFKEYASKNLVLVEVDFPKMKPIAESTRMQNVRLAQRYGIQGFPTVVVLNGDGQVVAELGYMQGGADAFIAVLERLRKG